MYTDQQLFKVAYKDTSKSDAYITSLDTLEQKLHAVQVVAGVSVIHALDAVARGYGKDSEMMHACVKAVRLTELQREMLTEITGYKFT
ncbi:hypothetical protein [Leptolyngbya phage Lbo240-yong1]|uniref:Uncharacterized protein n=1 Tax=Leptolyngbya phage Lbo240-yong1 TaxID=2928836 RepID=A0A9X9E183_9CAUD|nr:hypothetical protein [Leptolyngbya phage Lbo240-yong1]